MGGGCSYQIPSQGTAVGDSMSDLIEINSCRNSAQSIGFANCKIRANTGTLLECIEYSEYEQKKGML